MWRRAFLAASAGFFTSSTVFLAPKGPGYVSHPANLPIEDRYVIDHLGQVKLAAVFDGHGGWQISEYLYQNIKSRIETLSKTNKKWDQVLNSAFDQLENEIVDLVRGSYKLGFSSVASVGSCATVALILDKYFVVANAGDCQAVLVTNKNGEIKGINICQIHSSNLKEEQQKLAKEHPGEEDIVRCKSAKACYVKGRLMPTRAFGDFHLKHEEFNNPNNLSHIFGFRRSRIENFTGPYITHKPDIQIRNIESGDKFLILATDGLWDELSEQQAAEIVYNAENAQEAADMLLEAALNHAAYDNNMKRVELNNLPFGKKRSYHDDITIIVVPLNS